MGSDRVEEELHELLADALAGAPTNVTLELSEERFARLGVALDVASRILEGRGYRLTRVVAQGRSWRATYERMSLPD